MAFPDLRLGWKWVRQLLKATALGVGGQVLLNTPSVLVVQALKLNAR